MFRARDHFVVVAPQGVRKNYRAIIARVIAIWFTLARDVQREDAFFNFNSSTIYENDDGTIKP